MLFKAKSWRNESLADELIKTINKGITKSVKLTTGPMNPLQANGDQSIVSFEDVIVKLG